MRNERAEQNFGLWHRRLRPGCHLPQNPQSSLCPELMLPNMIDWEINILRLKVLDELTVGVNRENIGSPPGSAK
jgi:hypothetical protein